MRRRDALRKVAGLGLAGAGLMACGRSIGVLGAAEGAIQQVADATPLPPACAVTPFQPSGPFYFDSDQLRSELSEGRPGVPLRMELAVVDVSGCNSIEGAVVDVWHADAAGLYSGFGNAQTDPDGETQADFMRGLQVTDAGGRVAFDTVWPGWYPSRTIHVHFIVYLGSRAAVTSQLYLPDAISDEVMAQPPCAERGKRGRSNQTDSLLSSGDLPLLMMRVTPEEEGYLARYTIGIRT